MHGDKTPFTELAWDRIAQWRAATEVMPFIGALADGSLPESAFSFYLTQDAIYLGDFARVLSTASALAPSAAAQAFFAESAHVSLTVEASLHRDWLAGHGAAGAAQASPVTTAYTDHLLAASVRGRYPVLVAAVLPCYWLYAHIAEVIVRRSGDLTSHPYARWIATYADPAFQEAAERARAFVDESAQGIDRETHAQMLVAFERSAMHEYLFFQQGLEQPRWPAPPVRA